MAVATTVIPTYPVNTMPFKVLCTASHGNYVKFFLYACPPEAEEWYQKLHSAAVTKFPVQGFEGSTSHPIELTLPVAGSYSFYIQELTKGAAAYGGSYELDPDSFDSESVIGDTAWTVVVGQRVTAEIGSQELGTATLVLWLWEATVRATTLAMHGELTPRLMDWKGDKARLACLDATVATKLAALTNLTVTGCSGAPEEFVDDLMTAYNTHITEPGVHVSDDLDNHVSGSFELAASVTTERMADALNMTNALFRRHQTNDMGEGVGSAIDHTGPYHTPADNLRTACGSDGASAQALSMWLKLADLRRAYREHAADATVHIKADTTNAVTGPSPLLDLYETFFGHLATNTPTLPVGEQTGAAQATALLGFAKG